MKKLLNDKDYSLSNLNYKINSLEDEHSEFKKREEKSKKSGNQEKNYLQTENQNLKENLINCEREIQNWKIKYNDLETIKNRLGYFYNIL